LQIKKSKQLYHVDLEYANGMTRRVSVKANDRQTAEKRALKFNRSAIGVKRNAN